MALNVDTLPIRTNGLNRLSSSMKSLQDLYELHNMKFTLWTSYYKLKNQSALPRGISTTLSNPAITQAAVQASSFKWRVLSFSFSKLELRNERHPLINSNESMCAPAEVVLRKRFFKKKFFEIQSATVSECNNAGQCWTEISVRPLGWTSRLVSRITGGLLESK